MCLEQILNHFVKKQTNKRTNRQQTNTNKQTQTNKQNESKQKKILFTNVWFYDDVDH